MSVLSDGPRSVASAARRLGLARQSVQRVVNDLIERGLAISAPDPHDARAPLLELTPAGRDLVTQLFARSEADREDLVATAGLSAQALLDAKSTVRALIDQLNARDQTRPK
jgi:DNA-binding MarR family transcriptional regulator